MRDLDLVTTDDLISELRRRHTGAARALCVISCSPADGSPKELCVRTVLVAQQPALLAQVVAGVTERLRIDTLPPGACS